MWRTRLSSLSDWERRKSLCDYCHSCHRISRGVFRRLLVPTGRLLEVTLEHLL